MHDAFDVGSGALARGAFGEFGEFGERAGLRHDRVDKVSSHGIGDAAQTAQSDAVGRLGMLTQESNVSGEIRQPQSLQCLQKHRQRAFCCGA